MRAIYQSSSSVPSDRRLDDVARGARVAITVDGEPLEAFEGESVAAALIASGRRLMRYTSRRSDPRGIFCGMGVCFECAMEIDGEPNRLACRTPVHDGMTVRTQHGERA